MNPTRPLVAFLTDEPMIWLLDLGQDIAAPLQIGQLAADYPPAWSPDGSMLYITLADGLYTYSIDTPQVAPQLLIPGGRAAVVSPDGRYLAFEMVQAGTPTIYVTALSNPAENRPLLEEGSACYGPQFASNSISLYFTCDVDGTLKMFHAGIKGVEPLEVGIANAQNPAPGPVEGIFAFDDGSTIYLATSDLSQITPLLRLSDRLLSRLRWHQEQQSAKG
jgi:Tol biopolymer transport system component